MEIIVIVDARRNPKDPFLRQLKHHPISGTRIMTRRELRKGLDLVRQPPGLTGPTGQRRGAA
jgi:hypothetical protein